MGATQGVAVSRVGTKISHLFFVDNILFCKANYDEWTKLKGLLNIYERSLGQTINKQKIVVFFSSNTTKDTTATIMEVIGGEAQIIQALKKKNECLTWYDELIEEAKYYLKKNQPQWQINVTQTEGNGSNQAFAKHNLTVTQELV